VGFSEFCDSESGTQLSIFRASLNIEFYSFSLFVLPNIVKFVSNFNISWLTYWLTD